MIKITTLLLLILIVAMFINCSDDSGTEPGTTLVNPDAPSISFISPVAGDSVLKGHSMQITIKLKAKKDPITKVQFFVDGYLNQELAAQANAADTLRSFNWQAPDSIGTHTFKVIAFAPENLEGTSTITNIRVIDNYTGTILPPILYIGKSWLFQITDTKETYQDSFFVKDTKLINFDNQTISVHLVAFPTLQHKNTDTIFYKYWKLENNQLIEYGWEKRSRNNYNNEYAARAYPRKVVVSDFNLVETSSLFNNDTLRITQYNKANVTAGNSTREAIGANYRSFSGWYGFPECDYTMYFSDNQLFKIHGYISGTFFTGYIQSKKDTIKKNL